MLRLLALASAASLGAGRVAGAPLDDFATVVGPSRLMPRTSPRKGGKHAYPKKQNRQRLAHKAKQRRRRARSAA